MKNGTEVKSLFPLSIMWHFVLHYSLRIVTSMKGWCPMNHSNAFSHLTLEERRIILAGISNGSTKSAIAKTIGKDQVILKPYLLKK